MGDFDRVEVKSGGANKKQAVFLGVLVSVLIGVVVVHFSKQVPQTATAAPVVGDGAAAAVVVGMSPEQALQALGQDPTAGLLTAVSAEDHVLATVPRNPFRLSETWRVGLIKPAEVHTAVVAPTVRNAYTPVVRTPAQPLKLDNYKLASIIRQGDQLVAVINGVIVSSGMEVDGARVLSIRNTGVTLQSVDAPDGPTVELTNQPKLTK